MSRTLSLLPLLPVLALSACAVGPTIDDRLASYVGRTELELVTALGVPTRDYETGGQKFLQYEEQRTIALPGGFAGAPIGPYGRGYYGGFGLGYTTYAPVQCDVTFALRDGRVASYTYRGQGCG
jgi:hypothetical protein